jgi:hypothetical protein
MWNMRLEKKANLWDDFRNLNNKRTKFYNYFHFSFDLFSLV